MSFFVPCILFAKFMIKFEEETNICVRYNEEFVKSEVHKTEILHKSFSKSKMKGPRPFV